MTFPRFLEINTNSCRRTQKRPFTYPPPSEPAVPKTPLSLASNYDAYSLQEDPSPPEPTNKRPRTSGDYSLQSYEPDAPRVPLYPPQRYPMHPGMTSSPTQQQSQWQPAYSQPNYSQPTYSQPAYSQPTYSQPAYSQPTYSQSAYSQPAYSQPSPYTLPAGNFSFRMPASAPMGTQEMVPSPVQTTQSSNAYFLPPISTYPGVSRGHTSGV